MEIQKLPTTRELAERFKKVLASWLTAEQMAEVVRLNAEDGSEGSGMVCHSHDFCDANMAMDEALNSLGVDTDDISQVLDLWNSAWALASEERFVPIP